jgi:hypothetical protein
MSRSVFILIVFLPCFVLNSFAQKKECKLKPKRFPSAFSHLSTDYVGMNLQADIIPKRFFQLETVIAGGALFRNNNDERYYGYNANLLRIGLGSNIEVRGMVTFPGKNIQLNYPEEINYLHPQGGAGVKVNLLSESSQTPGLSLMAEYQFYNNNSHYQANVIIDKLTFRVLKISIAGGPRVSANGSSLINYSAGLVMKDRNKKLGIYSFATNRMPYLQNVFNMGIVYSDNLNYVLKVGYGVHQSDGLIMVSYTGLLNYSSVQSRVWSLFLT